MTAAQKHGYNSCLQEFQGLQLVRRCAWECACSIGSYSYSVASACATGLCPFNFTALEDTLVRTAGDCPAPLALYVGSVICCPQLESLFQVSLGLYSLDSGNLALNSTEAAYCFKDIENLMASFGANTSVGDLCAAEPANLTSGLCPITKVSQLQRIVNTTKLLDACQSVDPLKECTEEPTCQSQITYVAYQMAGERLNSTDHYNRSNAPPGAKPPLSPELVSLFSVSILKQLFGSSY